MSAEITNYDIRVAMTKLHPTAIRVQVKRKKGLPGWEAVVVDQGKTFTYEGDDREDLHKKIKHEVAKKGQ